MIFGPYLGLVREVHDGDTVLLDLDLGFGVFFNSKDWDGRPRLSCRVFGINADELSTETGKLAWLHASALLPVGTRVRVWSHGWDKYGGRFDGTIMLPDGRDFAATMVADGYAVAL